MRARSPSSSVGAAARTGWTPCFIGLRKGRSRCRSRFSPIRGLLSYSSVSMPTSQSSSPNANGLIVVGGSIGTGRRRASPSRERRPDDGTQPLESAHPETHAILPREVPEPLLDPHPMARTASAQRARESGSAPCAAHTGSSAVATHSRSQSPRASVVKTRNGKRRSSRQEAPAQWPRHRPRLDRREPPQGSWGTIDCALRGGRDLRGVSAPPGGGDRSASGSRAEETEQRRGFTPGAARKAQSPSHRCPAAARSGGTLARRHPCALGKTHAVRTRGLAIPETQRCVHFRTRSLVSPDPRIPFRPGFPSGPRTR